VQGRFVRECRRGDDRCERRDLEH